MLWSAKQADGAQRAPSPLELSGVRPAVWLPARRGAGAPPARGEDILSSRTIEFPSVFAGGTPSRHEGEAPSPRPNALFNGHLASLAGVS